MATEKTCFKCSATKPLDHFYRHPRMSDGHLNKCKECAKRDVRAHRAANDHVREYDRQRASLPHRVALRERVFGDWVARHPERRKAQQQVMREIRAGRMERLPCWVCGEWAEAHHPDYSSPLDVVWLCPLHHRRAHALVGA